MTAAQVAEAIAAAINANTELAAQGVVASALGTSVGIVGSLEGVPIVTDAGIALGATPSIPTLPSAALFLLGLALLAVAARSAARAG